MKHLQLLSISLLLCSFGFSQNQSDGLPQSSFFNPTVQQFTGVFPQPSFPIAPEIFRFRPGLVTQSDAFTDPMEPFSFDDARWFSIVRLQTSANQTVYGLRFQLPNRGVTFGYQDIGDSNPRIQWIGTGQNLGNFEFRVANNFMSTNSDLVATMRNDTGTVFGTTNPSFFNDSKVGVFDTQFDKALNIFQELSSSNTTFSIEVLNNSEASQNNGVYSRVRGTAGRNFAFNALVDGTADQNFGLNATVIGTASDNFGVFADVSNAIGNIAIYGEVPTTGGTDFAGFFDGDLTYTGSFFHTSDKKLKENVDVLDNALADVIKLQPKTYDYIESKKINLSQGKQYGFIAQELEEVFPELVRKIKKPVFDKNNEVTEYLEYKSVNYLGLIAILTASIQELTAEVNQLKENKETYVVYENAFSPEELAKIAHNGYRLEQNYPNPFQGSSSIAYALPEAENNASIMIFDMTGKTIKEYPLKEKQGQLQIDSQDFRPGIYLYSLIGNNKEIITKRMIVK